MKASLVTRAAMSSAWGFSHRATMPSLDFFTASQSMLYACPKACGKSTCQHMLNICEKHFKHMQKTCRSSSFQAQRVVRTAFALYVLKLKRC